MVFVHARNATVKTALTLREMAANQGDAAAFHAQQSPEYGAAEKQVQFDNFSPAYPMKAWTLRFWNQMGKCVDLKSFSEMMFPVLLDAQNFFF